MKQKKKKKKKITFNIAKYTYFYYIIKVYI